MRGTFARSTACSYPLGRSARVCVRVQAKKKAEPTVLPPPGRKADVVVFLKDYLTGQQKPFDADLAAAAERSSRLEDQAERRARALAHALAITALLGLTVYSSNLSVPEDRFLAGLVGGGVLGEHWGRLLDVLYGMKE